MDLLASDRQDLFNIANSLFHRNKTKTLPVHESATQLADCFATYFQDKIRTLRTSLLNHTEGSSVFSLDSQSPDCSLFSFRPVTDAEVYRLLKQSSSKFCSIDPVPTKLVKDCSDILTPLIRDIVNLCLRDGLPDTLKTAIIKPILKKPNLDPETLKNYRPISNLAFLSKVVEKVVAERLIEHMQMNNLQEPLQSAYKHLHSTETALLKVQDHILRNLDQGKGVVLLLLDLRAAFDTVDHGLLLKTLETTMGIKGQCLQWLTSYLEHRQQSVSIGGVQSTSHTVTWSAAGICAWPSVVHYLYHPPSGHAPAPRHLLPPLCR